MVDVGKRVRRIRKAAGLRQVDLANMIHMTQSYIAGIENNTHKPSLTVLQAIAEALNVDISEFIGNVNTLQETGLTNDEVHLIMTYRSLSDSDKGLAQTMMKRFVMPFKSARYTNLPITNTTRQKIEMAGW